MESFSDGVIAVAITLLVLNITVPAVAGAQRHGLGHELVEAWPEYAAYVTSFATIGIIWINHHVALTRLREPDHAILALNLLVLLSICLLPFTTDLLATYLKAGRGENLAAALYSSALLAMSLAFSALNYHILFPKSHLLMHEIAPERRRTIFTRALTGLIPYVVATAFAVVSPYITLVICAGVGVFYALPLASSPDLTA